MRDRTEFYELDRVVIDNKQNFFASAALLCCGLCSGVIDSMGGPGSGVVCVRCGDELKAGRLRGAVVWENENV